jgi:hypothetical protein
MNNFKIFSIFTLLLFIGTKELRAGTFVDAASFQQLNFEDQVEIIDNARDLSSQMEYNLKYLVKNENNNNYKLYVRAVLDLIIKSSHAQINDSLIKSADLCIYGGWVSIISGKVGGRSVCTNPANINEQLENRKNIDPKIKALLMKTVNAHKDESLTSKCVGKSIMCAPHLYGYKSIEGDKKEPFCGQKQTSPYNASMDCSRQVAKLSKEKQDENYLNIIKDQSEKGELSEMVDMFKVFYDVCACKGKNELIDSSYAKRMFEQRTCYSWMKQNQLIMSRFKQAVSCNELEVTEPSGENFKNLFNWMASADENLQDILASAPGNGTDYFEQLRTNKISDAEFTATVKKDNGVYKQQQNWKKYREGQYAANKHQCSTLFEEENEDVLACKPLVKPSDSDPKSGIITLEMINGAPLTGPEIAQIASGFSSLTTVSITHKDKNTFAYSDLSADKDFTVTLKRKPEVVCLVKLAINKKASPGSCKIEELASGVKEGNIGYKVSLEVKDGVDRQSLTLELPKEKPEGFEVIKIDDQTMSYQFPKNQKKPMSLVHEIMKKDGDSFEFFEDTSCTKAVTGGQEDPETQAETFKVTIKEKEDQGEMVVYSIDSFTVGEEVITDFTGYTVEWFTKGKKVDIDKTESDEEPDVTDSGLGDPKTDDDDNDQNEETKKDEDKTELAEVLEREGSDDIIMPKQKDTYDVYVKITKTGTEKEKTSNVLAVPVISSEETPPVQNNRNPALRQKKQFTPIRSAPNKLYQGNS